MDENNKKETRTSDLSEDEIKRQVMAGDPDAGLGNQHNDNDNVNESKDSTIKDPYLKKAEEMKVITGKEGLGNIKPIGEINFNDSNEKANAKVSMGYIPLNVSEFPSRGRFYSPGFKISMRAASVREIRDFSTVDETNVFDVDDKLNNILVSCVNVMHGNSKGSYKDLLEEDRIYVIMSIRELTFIDGESKLELPAICKRCDTSNTYELRTDVLEFQDLDENIEKYLDNHKTSYIFKTVSSGEIVMKPPTIGIMQVITKFIKEKEEKGEKWDKSFMQLLPYIRTEWRGFNEKAIFEAEVLFQGWSTKKFMTIFNLAEKIKVGIKQNLVQPCDNCSEEVSVPVVFPSGIKSLFIVQDTSDELL